MTFSSFAKRLYPIVGEGCNTGAFTKSLLASITEDAEEILDSYSKNTYKSYFNDTNSIQKFAKRIAMYVEPEAFVSYINHLPTDAVLYALCNSFSDIFPGADTQDIGEKLAALFAGILRDEAAKTRKSSQEKISERIHEDANDGKTTILDAEPDDKTTAIHQQPNVVQHGTNNLNLTNNGTMILNFGCFLRTNELA
ncbi:hypothetical protein [uncultured Selenomonas sp.]|uniref:hypothetical protein n=1 Tax=uncultured Selenomonas sp. TaxID=159275 RepID=UPI0028D5B332|nr:hypothetical protein [uncultured Selenomonas sp.]